MATRARLCFLERDPTSQFNDTRVVFHVETDKCVSAARLLGILPLDRDVHYVVRSSGSLEIYPAMWAFSAISRSHDIFIPLTVVVETPADSKSWRGVETPLDEMDAESSASARINFACFIHECLGLDLERDLFLESSALDGRGGAIPFQALARALALVSGVETDVPRSMFLGLVNGTYGNFPQLDSSWRYNYSIPDTAMPFRVLDMSNPLYGWIRNVVNGSDLARFDTASGDSICWPLTFLTPLSIILRQCGYASCPLILPRSLTLSLNPNALRVFYPGQKIMSSCLDPLRTTAYELADLNGRLVSGLDASSTLSVNAFTNDGYELHALDIASAISQEFMTARGVSSDSSAGYPDSATRVNWIDMVDEIKSGQRALSIRFPDPQFGDTFLCQSTTPMLAEIGFTGDTWRHRVDVDRDLLNVDPITRVPLAFAIKEGGKVFKDNVMRDGKLSTAGLPRLDKLAVMILSRKHFDALREPGQSISWQILKAGGALRPFANASNGKARARPLTFKATFDSPMMSWFPELYTEDLFVPEDWSSTGTGTSDSLTPLRGLAAGTVGVPTVSETVPLLAYSSRATSAVESFLIRANGSTPIRTRVSHRVIGSRRPMDEHNYSRLMWSWLSRSLDERSILERETKHVTRARSAFWLRDSLVGSVPSRVSAPLPYVIIDTRDVPGDPLVTGHVDLIETMDFEIDVTLTPDFSCVNKNDMIWVMVSYGRLPCIVGQDAISFYPRATAESVPINCLFV